jgi:ribonuclease HII
MLLHHFQDTTPEAGCDEAGRGCLAGPVFAAAVILPPAFEHPLLNDSKQLTKKHRDELRIFIEKNALSFAVASLDAKVIDKINILQASITAMHLAIDKLTIAPSFLIIDGNKFKPYKNVAHQTIVKGDAKYASIAAASILAKTYRDEFMEKLHPQYPEYDWLKNKGTVRKRIVMPL